MSAVRLAIIDDHAVVINGLQAMLAGSGQLEVIFTTTEPSALLAWMEGEQPDVLLVDIQMPAMSGVDLCRLLNKQYPDVRILAFSSFDDTHFVRQVLRNGASGYVLKNAERVTLVEAICAVHEGGEYLDETIKRLLLQESITGQRRSVYEVPLTKREGEILRLIARELSNQQIADQLFISLRTVETHRLNLSQKLGVKNTAGLTREAMRRGLID